MTNNFLEILAEKIAQNHDKIEDFFSKKFSENPALIYNSVDLRHCKFKVAPVDTNCFPAGFNNLKNDSFLQAQKTCEIFLKKHFPSAKKIAIIPENHTRNLRYLSNVSKLAQIISAVCEVKIGSLVEAQKIELESGEIIDLAAVSKVENKICLGGDFFADLVILNNDLTDGVPQILENIAQPIIPPLQMGWFKRKKSHHFDIYNSLAAEISQILQIDPWLISSIHRDCEDVNFKEQKGLEALAGKVDEVLLEVQKKYDQYQISQRPYCYVKSDNGTYGMAVWAVENSSEILTINKKERNKMNAIKGAVPNTRVIIQEGIPTSDKIQNKIAEPMIYSIGGAVVGNLFRVNESRDEKNSLNAAGASFCDLNELENHDLEIGLSKEKIGAVYGLIARMTSLAAAIENQQNYA